MSVSDQEREEARAAYGWDDVQKDIALVTPLTMQQCSAFTRPFMQTFGVHPYDLVDWVYRFYRDGADHEALAQLIGRVFEAGARNENGGTP